MTARLPDDLFNEWVEKAKAVSVLNCALKFGFQPKGGGAKLSGRIAGEIVGPCPRCGGVDRFSIKPSESAWYCRGAGQGGYDSISLARYLLRDASFIETVENLTGEPRPQSKPITDEERAAREALAAKRKTDDEAAQAKQHREHNQFREDERRRCHGIWKHGEPAPGSMVEAYFRHRCIPGVPAGARLRFHPEMHLRHPAGAGGKIIWTGPAMIAPIIREGQFAGLHTTWLDPRLSAGAVPAEAKGKLMITADGELLDRPVKDVELLDVKRSRGSKQGGFLLLVPASSGVVRRIVIGEGIETVLSVWASMLEAGEELSTTEFRSAIDLGNLGGKSAGSVIHPHKRKQDAIGRSMRIMVSGPTPDLADPTRSIQLPDSVVDVLLLADGDSDRFVVECAIARAAARWARPGRTIRDAWPDEGGDFNDMRVRLVREREAA